MIILGIETSCDETSAALLEIKRGKFKLLSQIISSSIKEQAKYGGIVPEVAARKQIEYIIPVLNETFKTRISNFPACAEASAGRQFPISKQIPNLKSKNSNNFGFRISDFGFVTAIAVTVGPGLATSLQVGIDTAKTLAYVWQKPLISVNHLEGHLYSPLLATTDSLQLTTNNKNKLPVTGYPLPVTKFPAIGLIASGGHTELILVKDYLKYKLLGRTRDDAAGEAFDKVAKLLGLGYPGGPVISKLAKQGDPSKYDFPRGMISSNDYDFSFSGLKTSVLYKLRDLDYENSKFKIQNSKLINNICASFQQAAIDVLAAKTMRAVKEYKAKTLLVGGGVAANPLLRKTLENETKKIPITYNLTPITYTGDNAAMIALAGYFRYKNKNFIKPNPQSKIWQQTTVQPNLSLV